MFLKIISSVLFLPFLIVGMIIAQVHLEGYWDSNITKSHESHWAIFYTIFIYIVQEISIIELTLQSLNVMGFIFVIPITMILRNKHKFWWGLLVLTPFITSSVDAYLNRYQFINLGASLLQILLISLVCLALLRCKKLNYYVEYTIAMYSNCLIHFLQLAIVHQLKLNFIITLLLGTLFIIMAENFRMFYERKQKEHLAQLHYESIRDDLTGLLNYRAFDQKMKFLAKKEDEIPTFIAVLDIDHFKKVNDTYGHLSGNEVLKTFSRKLKLDIHRTFPPHCAVYRFGGEEFTIVVKHKDGDKLVQILNDINEHFSKYPVRTVNGKNIPFSFSGGLTKHLKNEDFTQTLTRADSLVYKAKNSGRKQILFD